MKALRKWFQTMRPTFDAKGYRKTLKNYRYQSGTYTSEGYALPIAILTDLSPRWMKEEPFHPKVHQTS